MIQYLHTLYFVVKGLILIIFAPFVVDLPLIWMGLGCIMVAAPVMALLEFHARRGQK